MKNLIIIGLLALGLVFCSATLSIGNPIITCPNGNAVDVDTAYKEWVPSDFPMELCVIFCNVPFSAEPMFKYPSILIGLASLSGTIEDQIIIIWFCDTITGKYMGFIEYNKNTDRHTILWISKFAPDGFEKYIYSVIDEINNSEDF